MSLFQNFTGTMQTHFLIGGPSGIMLKKVSGGFEVRNSGDTALATLKTANLDVTGDIVVSGDVDGVDIALLKSDFDTHDNKTDNPHSVTKSQVELGNVTNYAQVKKIGSSTDNAIMRFNGTTGDLPKDSLATIDDSGSISIPAGQGYKVNGKSAITEDGNVAFSGDQPMGGFKLTGLGLCTADGDAARKSYVDSVASGLDVKASVRLATTAALPACTASGGPGAGKILTADAVGALSVDGVATALNDRILVKNQSTGADNGIYKVTTLGVDGSVAFVLTRATDANEDDEVTAGLFTFVSEGSTNLDKGFVLTTNDPITVDTTALVFSQFSGAGQIIDGAGLAKNGDTLSVNVDDSTIEIEINSDALRVKASGITANELASNAVTTAKILDSNVTTDKINDDAVTNDKIGDSAVDTLQLAADAVETDKITNLHVTNAKLASNAVTTDKITNLHVTTDKINDDAVTNDKIGDSAVDTLQLAADAVETAKIKDGEVTNAKLASGIDAAKIAGGNVTNTIFDYLEGADSNIQAQLDALAPDTGTSKFIKVAVGTTTASSTTSIPEDAVIKNVYTRIKTAYVGTNKTIQVTVDGSTPLEIQATSENSPTVINTYKSEPILDVGTYNYGVVKVTVGSGITQGAADVIVEYVEAFLS